MKNHPVHQPLPEVRKMVDALKAARLAANLKQADVADKIGISQSMISDMERGWREPRLCWLLRYCDAVGVRFDWVIGQ